MCSPRKSTAELEDCALLDRARALNRVLVSQDEDLLTEATRRQRSGIPFNGVFYAHQLGITVGRFVNDLEVLAQCGEPEDYRNRVEFLPL